MVQLGLEGDFVGRGVFLRAVGGGPETLGFSLGRKVLGGNLTAVAERTGLPDVGPVVQVGTLLGLVRRTQGKFRQGHALGVAERNHERGVGAAGRSGLGADRLLHGLSRGGAGRGLGRRLNLTVSFGIVVVGGTTAHGGEGIATEVGVDGPSVLALHATLGGDDGVGGHDAAVGMHDGRAYPDAVLVADGHLDDGEAVLLGDGLQHLEVHGEAGELRAEVRVVVVGLNVSRLGDEVDEGLVQFGLGFGIFGGHGGVGMDVERIHGR